MRSWFRRTLCLVVATVFVSLEIQLIVQLNGEPISDQEEISPIKLHKAKRTPDGFFNGIPVNLQVVSNKTFTKPKSLLHCVAEDYQADNWMHRSCHFQFMCFNLDTREFSIYSRPEDIDLRHSSKDRPFMDLSQTLIQSSTAVSLGGIPQTNEIDVNQLHYFPLILSQPPTIFYSLPENVVLIPFHSNAAWDPRHVVWQDFLSIFTLMHMFQLEELHPLLLQFNMPGGEISKSCREDPLNPEKCKSILQKFLPLMTSSSSTTLSQVHEELKLKKDQRKSKLVCAKHGLMGIGALTDHGTHKTKSKPIKFGKRRREAFEQNHGRGDLFWRFRTFCLENLGVDESQGIETPHKVIFSSNTLDFEKQSGLMKENFDSNQVSIQSRVLKEMDLMEQVKLMSQTVVFITNYETESVACTFLPRGSTVIFFFDEIQSINGPSRQNYDFFNNLAYLRVHWFPIGSMGTDKDMDALVRVVSHALNARG